MTRFVQFDVVRLKFGMPEWSIPPGSEAAVLDVFPAGYQIEVVDDQGRTLYLGGADDSDLEPVVPV